jgi:hypothetical protein
MAYRQIMVQAAAAVVICAASAIAQAAPTNKDGPAPSPAQMAWHRQMCTDHYARHVGEIAYLEEKLSLTDAQRPLFESWKDVVLASAKTRASECAGMHPDFSHPPSILDREARLHDMLQKRLAEMDAQRPAMTALYQSLTPDQKHIFDGIGFEHGPMYGRPHMHDSPGMHGGPGGGHDEGMPPEPDQG